MPKQAPKPPELRMRSNYPDSGEWRTMGAPASDPPNRPTDCAHGRCVEAWAAWWSDPVSGMWSEGQRDAVSDLAVLFCAWMSDPAKSSLHTEVRQVKTALGLTPRGLRDLRWRYPEEVPDVPQREKRVRPDPRLKAVGNE